MDMLDELGRLEEAGEAHTVLPFANALAAELATSLVSSTTNMLPSFIHTLPSGTECGSILALDLGGSTLRVALVELDGRRRRPQILDMHTYAVGDDVKTLGMDDFFDWIVERIHLLIQRTKTNSPQVRDWHAKLRMGVAWSFPIHQTSVNTGLLMGMGKGYRVSEQMQGRDILSCFEAAFLRKGLDISLDAVINDTIATLVSHSYTNPATNVGLILGTGCNAAVACPLSSLGPCKLSDRPAEWLAQAQSVIVNTELSMFGTGILPATRWDRKLAAASDIPGFQPFEEMVSGRYLGEICRLAVLDAVEGSGMFGGVLPSGMESRWGLETTTLSVIEEDQSPLLANASQFFHSIYSSSNATTADMRLLRRICVAVSTRAAALVAASLISLATVAKLSGDICVSFCGSVMEKYPRFRERVQAFLDQLAPHRILLEPTGESGVLGAAMAVAAITTVADAQN